MDFGGEAPISREKLHFALAFVTALLNVLRICAVIVTFVIYQLGHVDEKKITTHVQLWVF